jgi:hypothetical protein
VTGRSFAFTRSLAVLTALIAAACSPSRGGERLSAEYDAETGRLRRLAVDVNDNGRSDAVSVMDGARIEHVEVDLDENGKPERWDFYRGATTLERVGFSRLNDGIMDAQAFYSAAGDLIRIEVSTQRDGRFNRIEFYEAGVLVRGEEDTNGDGRADKWETYRRNADAGPNEPPYVIASVAFDDSGRGRPERRVIYGEAGEPSRVEVDAAGAKAGSAGNQ